LKLLIKLEILDIIFKVANTVVNPIANSPSYSNLEYCQEDRDFIKMLQRGFLTSNNNTQEKKKSNDFLKLGGAICFIVGAIAVFMVSYYLGLVFIIIGSIMVSVALWKNAISQNKNRFI